MHASTLARPALGSATPAGRYGKRTRSQRTTPPILMRRRQPPQPSPCPPWRKPPRGPLLNANDGARTWAARLGWMHQMNSPGVEGSEAGRNPHTAAAAAAAARHLVAHVFATPPSLSPCPGASSRRPAARTRPSARPPPLGPAAPPPCAQPPWATAAPPPPPPPARRAPARKARRPRLPGLGPTPPGACGRSCGGARPTTPARWATWPPAWPPC